MRSHDFGLCQAACTGMRLEFTEAFRQDYANRTCTLSVCEDEKQFDCSMRRWARLLPRLAPLGVRLVVPEQFQHFVQEAA